MSTEDEYDEILREKAKQEGVTFEDYKKSVLPFISPKKDTPEELKKKLGMIQETAKTYGEIEKSGAPPPIKIRLANAAGDMMGNMMSSRVANEDSVEAGVEKMTTSLAKLKMLDIARDSVFGKGKKDKDNGEEANGKVLVETMREAMGPVTKTLEIINSRLDGQDKSESRAMLDELKELMTVLVKERTGSGSGGQLTNEEIMEKAADATTRTTAVLKKMGFDVSQDKITKAQLDTILKEKEKEMLEEAALDPEKYRAVLESKGYKITGGPMKWEDVQKLLDAERKKIVEEANEDVRIKELGSIIREAVGGFMGLFQPIVGKWFEEGIDTQTNEKEAEAGQHVEGEVVKEEAKEPSSAPQQS